MKVIDASAMIDLLSGTERANSVAALLGDDLFAPDLLVAEVLSFLRRMSNDKRMTDAAADALAEAIEQAPVEYVHTWMYAHRIWQLRHTMSSYDATYVALAEDLGSPLITTDLRLARAATGIVPILSV